MRHYETAFLITPKLEEEETEKLIQDMADVVAKKKGKMVRIEKWGKKKLAYPIEKLDEAFYVFFHYEGDPEIPFELERRFRQTEAVIRYLTLKKEVHRKPRKKRRKAEPRKEPATRAEAPEAPAEEKAPEGTEDTAPETESSGEEK